MQFIMNVMNNSRKGQSHHIHPIARPSPYAIDAFIIQTITLITSTSVSIQTETMGITTS